MVQNNFAILLFTDSLLILSFYFEILIWLAHLRVLTESYWPCQNYKIEKILFPLEYKRFFSDLLFLTKYEFFLQLEYNISHDM